MQTFITVNTASEMLCFLVALFCLYRDKDPIWRLLILFLFITCLVEISAIYMRRVLHQPNFMLYNVFSVVECFVLSLFFHHLYKAYGNPKRHIRMLSAWLVIFLLVYFTELCKNHYSDYIHITSIVESIALVLASIYYYYRMLQEDQFRRLSTYAPFWWVSGTLCFYFATIASNVFFTYLVKDRVPELGQSIRYIIFNILNVILYLTWSYSFICRYRQRTLSSLSD